MPMIMPCSMPPICTGRWSGSCGSRRRDPLYIFFTSDHGEELGENGPWGHDQLDLVSPLVSIMFYGERVAEQFIRELRDRRLTSHYQLGKKIAGVLGYEIRNAGEEDGIVYVNGVASLGRSGYMRFRQGEGGRPENFQVIRSPFSAREAEAKGAD